MTEKALLSDIKYQNCKFKQHKGNGKNRRINAVQLSSVNSKTASMLKYHLR